MGEEGVPSFTCKQGMSMLYIINPKAGFKISSLCKVVILGGRNPLEVFSTSNAALGSGVVVPIPTCAKDAKVSKKAIAINGYFIFILFVLEYWLNSR